MKTTYKFLSVLIAVGLMVQPVVASENISGPRARTGTGESSNVTAEFDAAIAEIDSSIARYQEIISSAQTIATSDQSTPQDKINAEKEAAAAQDKIRELNREKRGLATRRDEAVRGHAQARQDESQRIENAGAVGEGNYKGAGFADATVPNSAQGCFESVSIDTIKCVEPSSKALACGPGDCDQKGEYFLSPSVVDFNSPISCKSYFGDGDVRANAQLQSKICRLIASSCQKPEITAGMSPETKEALHGKYIGCVAQATQDKKRSVIVGAQKCAAIYIAAKETTGFEEQPKVGGTPITCKTSNPEGYAFDYKGCVSFLNWYMGLQATEMGLGLYNEADKTMTGMKAQNDMAQEIQKGNGQTAGLDGAKRSTMAAADAESRNKLFFATKGTAITAQLAMFTTASSIQDECNNSACCKLFAAKGEDKIKGDFFPNKGARDHMIAEVIKAGGQAAVAALKEAELKKQAALMQAAKAQLAGPEDESEEGFMKFCQQYPQDVRCLGPGNRLSLGSNGYGSNFGGQNFGLGDLGAATTDDFNTETIAPGTGPGAGAAAVGGVGTMNKAAAEAKDIFNAPRAAAGGGGAPAGGGAGGGGAGASASANGLSNDPGVQEEKKEDPLKVTSKKAAYDGGAGYSGGSWRAGAGKKDAAAENPFAAMFNKNKGRDIAAAKEIDSPASDLFTKISNRYGEVQKRKGLMDVADTNIR